VPLVVVSPFAKKAYTSHVVSDHTSILRFIEARFGLPALSERDANATALFDFFDFQNPAFAAPPTIAEPVVNQAERDYCETTFRK
jgi:phospholipase C